MALEGAHRIFTGMPRRVPPDTASGSVCEGCAGFGLEQVRHFPNNFQNIIRFDTIGVAETIRFIPGKGTSQAQPMIY